MAMGAGWVSETASDGSFPVSGSRGAAAIWAAAGDAEVVHIAARDLATDVERVSGKKPRVAIGGPTPAGDVLLVGTLGRSPVIDQLVAQGRLPVGDLRGQWEAFIITVVDDPLPGTSRALVIVGSDRRGTAYGVYELSQAIGVSPWHWWSDVAPLPRAELHVARGARRFGPPSVKFRGIFINDEDWGLQPWAALTHEPETGNIGPRTYQRVFELLLRLKANLLWPGMHPTTRPFNADPENARLADAYAVVMGSSHAEPMLRNNVGEWRAPSSHYNYLANREGVLGYWEERVRSNARYENIYTLGMRGIHDSHMVGPQTEAERITALERIFHDQRELLARHLPGKIEAVPQMFCAYKEVLELYRAGLKVPEDVTIVWPDDNFGYVRDVALPSERGRRGGFGVYYHLSYLGRPLSYLWLATTPPALIWHEMRKSYDHGADRLWVVNVGDIKPAELTTEFFLQMAWDIDRWTPDTLEGYLAAWAEREFGTGTGAAVAQVLETYYRLNSARKPEHLQWWLPGQRPRPSTFSRAEVVTRMRAFETLEEQVRSLRDALPSRSRDAFFQLVEYPVLGAAAANARVFHAEFYAAAFNSDFPLARRHAASALAAEERLRGLTRHYNEGIAGGKWRHFMALEPADNQWASMRISPVALPSESMAAGAEPIRFGDVAMPAPRAGRLEFVPADAVTSRAEASGARWQRVPGLGRSGCAAVVLPFDATPVPEAGASLDFDVEVAHPGPVQVDVHLLPTHPLGGATTLRVGISIGGGPIRSVSVPVELGSAAWAQGVLDGRYTATVELNAPSAGRHRLSLHRIDAGVIVDGISLGPGHPQASP